jgi:CubicO group peptidase (beta-lactamase class C family)
MWREFLRLSRLQRPSDITTDQLFKALVQARLESAPGTKYSYSNLGYLVLSLIVARAAKQPYDQYVHDELWRPLGIKSAIVDGSFRPLAGVVGWKIAPSDYLRFLECYEPEAQCPLRNANAILREIPPVIVNQHAVYYTMGMLVRPAKDDGRIWWHNGGGDWPWRPDTPSIGNIVVRSNWGLTWLIVYEPRPSKEGIMEIDKALWETADSIHDSLAKE